MINEAKVKPEVAPVHKDLSIDDLDFPSLNEGNKNNSRDGWPDIVYESRDGKVDHALEQELEAQLSLGE